MAPAWLHAIEFKLTVVLLSQQCVIRLYFFFYIADYLNPCDMA